MKISGHNLSMIRGDSESLTVGIKAGTFAAGDTVTFTVRKKAACPNILIQKTVTDFDEEGKAVIGIEHADTEGLPFGDYAYDVELTRADGTVTTLVGPATLRLLEEVTY